MEKSIEMFYKKFHTASLQQQNSLHAHILFQPSKYFGPSKFQFFAAAWLAHVSDCRNKTINTGLCVKQAIGNYRVTLLEMNSTLWWGEWLRDGTQGFERLLAGSSGSHSLRDKILSLGVTLHGF